ncbi:response regulator [Bdellovibrionota bacterium FG-1]
MTQFYPMVGKKLLVADDSLTIQKVIRLALSNEGYEIQAVSDGNDTLEQISVFRPDVVLIDVSLPTQSAFEIKRAVNEHIDLQDVRFVLMSSAYEKVDEAQATEVGFHGRLTKPFDPAHLRQVLTQVLEQVTAKRRETTALIQRPTEKTPDLDLDLPPADELELEVLPPPPFPNDDWLSQPLAPEEPLLPPPPPEAVKQLWEAEPAPPQPPIQESNRGDPDGDIRHLTESTIRMSGLDDFQWSVNEPSLKADFTPSAPETTVSPPSDFEAGGADFYREPEEPSPVTPPPFTAPSFIPPAPFVEEPQIQAISQSQIEEMIRKEIHETFQKMAEKMLPEVAEKIIKQEIHRMLSEI